VTCLPVRFAKNNLSITTVFECSVSCCARLRVTVVSFVLHSPIFWGSNLGVSKAGTREDTADVAMLTTEKDIDEAYEEAVHVVSAKSPKEEKKVDATTSLQEDDYCDFGTKCSESPSFLPLLIVFFSFLCSLLMTWVLSNVSNKLIDNVFKFGS
jgi:hypothetical protein